MYSYDLPSPLSAMFEGGGVPDKDWNDPLPKPPSHIHNTELEKLREAIIREVDMTLKKEIILFQSTLRTEMEAHVNKLVGEVRT